MPVDPTRGMNGYLAGEAGSSSSVACETLDCSDSFAESEVSEHRTPCVPEAPDTLTHADPRSTGSIFPCNNHQGLGGDGGCSDTYGRGGSSEGPVGASSGNTIEHITGLDDPTASDSVTQSVISSVSLSYRPPALPDVDHETQRVDHHLDAQYGPNGEYLRRLLPVDKKWPRPGVPNARGGESWSPSVDPQYPNSTEGHHEPVHVLPDASLDNTGEHNFANVGTWVS